VESSLQLSEDAGPVDEPLIRETIGDLFNRMARIHAEREALVVRHQGIRWSYGELAERVEALATGLLSLGLERGDRVGIWAPNCAEWLLTQVATARAGLVLVNINPAYRGFELEYSINKVGCRVLILAPAVKTSDYLQIVNDLAPELCSSAPGDSHAAALPELRAVIRLGSERTPGMLNFADVCAAGTPADRQRLDAIAASLDPGDAINIQFTSGTTGSPKGATLTHRNILNNGYFVGHALQLQERDRVCIPVPLYHCFGMVMGNLACIAHGATMVYPAEVFDPLATLQTVQLECCTALYGVPTMFIALLDHPQFGSFDLSRLRTGIMAGAPCPVEVMNRVAKDMHMSEVTIAYGMTETSPVSTQTAVDDPLEIRVSTVGRVHPHVAIKIVDPTRRTVARGKPGELCTKGYSVMRGYWNDDARTGEAIDAEGWMHTGDLATMDAQGYVNIVGRIKDMVIRGGENVYPREVEEFLYRHPGVQDVQVIGVPDLKYGEELCAWIKLRPNVQATEEEIREFCRDRIAHYKIPRHVRFVDAFPMTITGKIQKYLMRKQMIEELGHPTGNSD
jgi:fatty-acyl-CoA synthase